jgi:hypothetical protein
MVSNSICPGSQRANRSSPIALDPAKAQAPVWRENFSSADTSRSGQLSADLMPGKKPGFRSREERKLQLRIDGGRVGTAALGCPGLPNFNCVTAERERAVEPKARLDSRGRLSPHGFAKATAEFRIQADVRSPPRRRVRVRSPLRPACPLRTNARSELLREAPVGVAKTSAMDDWDQAPNHSAPRKLL